MIRPIYRFPTKKLATIIIENGMLWAEKWRILGEKSGFNLSLEERGLEISNLDIAAALTLIWKAKKKKEFVFSSMKSINHFNYPLLSFPPS